MLSARYYYPVLKCNFVSKCTPNTCNFSPITKNGEWMVFYQRGGNLCTNQHFQYHKVVKLGARWSDNGTTNILGCDEWSLLGPVAGTRYNSRQYKVFNERPLFESRLWSQLRLVYYHCGIPSGLIRWARVNRVIRV
jgi:hypothetical protein